MEEKREYYTVKGYQLNSKNKITASVEDYLEMICRNAKEEGYIRMSFLASCLNVRTSSASKMVGNLKELGLIEYEKYGVIKPTEKGWELGNYLLYRHDVINDFLCTLNNSDSELEQTEQIEHFFREDTVRNLERLTQRLMEKTDI